MSYKVDSRRIVPHTTAGRSIATGLIVESPNLHGGECAVCVTLASGFGAWGFAAGFDAAETAAVSAARLLEMAA